MNNALALKPFTVEISRTDTYVQWTTLLVYATDEAHATELAQPRADEANALPDFDCPFGYLTDDGSPEPWEVQTPTPAAPDEIEDATTIINEPEEEED